MTAQRLVAPLTAFVSAMMLAAGLTAPAHAAGGHITSRSTVLYRNCFFHPFTYTLDGFGDRWTLRARLITAAGRVVDDVTVAAGVTVPVGEMSGRGAFRLCAGTTPVGSYRIRSEVTWQASDGLRTQRLADESLRLRLPRTKTKVTVKPRKTRLRKVVRVRATVTEERPYGYFTQRGSRVRLYVRHHGAWRRTGVIRRTNASGMATFKVRWRWAGRHKVKAITVRDRYHAKSTSRTVVVTGRKVKKPVRR